jgi:hypothetical protein
MRERDSSLPEKMTGGLKNRLGAMALTCTNDVKSIGRAQSSGCFRMLNSAVLHLASLAETGTTVSVVSSLPKQEVSQTPEASPPTQAQPRAESAEPPAQRGLSPEPQPCPRLSRSAGFHLAQMIGAFRCECCGFSRLC